MTLRLAPTLALPAEAVTETFGILAARGAGKSNTAAVMAEEMFRAKLPFVVVDPVGCWWGLRSSRDGKGPGLPLPIFGGRRGDVPLERTGGQLLADLVVDQRLSCVLDLSQFDSEGSKKAFLLEFARRLYQRNEAPLHLFLEEADDYIPQRPMRDEAQLLRAWENIVRRGRSRGLGITLITQRSASLNKSVLTQVQTLIPMRTTGPQDIAAIREWVKYHHQGEDILASLAGLEDGEAWVWSPHFLRKTVRVRFRLRETFDSGATPKMAAGGKAPATLADVDLKSIEQRMAATIEKAKAEDPRELRRRIAGLEAELARAKAATPAPATEKRVEVPVLREPEIKRLEAAAMKIGTAGDRIRDVGQAVAAGAAKLAAELVVWKMDTSRPPQQPVARAVTPAPALMLTPPPRVPRTEPADGLTGPEQRILDALAWLESLGISEPAQAAVAFLAGYTLGGGAFNNPRGSLHMKGLLLYRGGDLITLTDAGRALARPPDAALTTDELHRRVLGRLPGPEQKILRVLLAVYPASLENDELARRSGYGPGGGAFNNPRGRLRSLGLIDYPQPGRVVALPVLFLEER